MASGLAELSASTREQCKTPRGTSQQPNIQALQQQENGGQDKADGHEDDRKRKRFRCLDEGQDQYRDTLKESEADDHAPLADRGETAVEQLVEGTADDYRQRDEQVEAVGRQLRLRNGQEDQAGEQPAPLEEHRGIGAEIGKCAPHGQHHRRHPGNRAEEQQTGVIPDVVVRGMLGADEAQEIVADEEFIPERPGVPGEHHRIPRHYDHRVEYEPPP
jgi:hypothetical protein